MINKKLIFKLSLLGLLVSIATLLYIPNDFEFYFWLPVLFISAYTIAKYCKGKYFINGFLTGLFNTFWLTATQYIFFKTYAEKHPMAMELFKDTAIPEQPRIFMLITNPIIGVVSATVLGILSLLTSRILKRRQGKTL
jgi:Zn-dependent protease with chaperone function